MDFSATARYYHLLEDLFIGPALQQTRVGQLNQLRFDERTARVLIVGEGNGRFLCALLKRYPELAITVVDSSAAMLEQAQQRLKTAGLSYAAVSFQIADLRTLELPCRHYQLIVANFFFSNFPVSDVERMVRTLERAATVDAQWLVGDFVLPVSGVLRLRAKLWLWLLYRFFGYTAGVSVRDLPEVDVHLSSAGLLCDAETLYCGRMLRSATYSRISTG
ncbi:MAG: class I SAM-dependent methyltransferase [Coraliomargarita sp.]